MRRRAILGCVTAMAAMACFSIDAIAEPGSGATVVRSLAEAPAANASGAPYASYVVFIPTHEETRATPEMLAAIRHVSDALAAAPDQAPSAALFLGAPDANTYDSAASATAIADLNGRFGFGLDSAGGAVLLFVHGDPRTAAREAVYARVFASSDTATIVAALNETGLMYDKSVNFAQPPTLWELIQHLVVPSTTPTSPHG